MPCSAQGRTGSANLFATAEDIPGRYSEYRMSWQEQQALQACPLDGGLTSTHILAECLRRGKALAHPTSAGWHPECLLEQRQNLIARKRW